MHQLVSVPLLPLWIPAPHLQSIMQNQQIVDKDWTQISTINGHCSGLGSEFKLCKSWFVSLNNPLLCWSMIFANYDFSCAIWELYRSYTLMCSRRHLPNKYVKCVNASFVQIHFEWVSKPQHKHFLFDICSICSCLSLGHSNKHNMQKTWINVCFKSNRMLHIIYGNKKKITS